jgi:hypothetical protein
MWINDYLSGLRSTAVYFKLSYFQPKYDNQPEYEGNWAQS